VRTEVIRSEVQRLLHQVPFHPFILVLENGGDRVPIGHPENIAFDPGTGVGGGSRDFYVINGPMRLFSTFDAVSSIALIERGESA
jgi:hypothetical protein